MKEYALPIMILSRVAMQHTDCDNEQSSPVQSTQEMNTRRPSGAVIGGQMSADSDKEKVAEIFSSFIEVILQCTEFVSAFTKIMIPVFDR